MTFGTDGLLYLTVGEIDGHSAQNTTLNGGKLLRIYKNGSYPHDNPWGNANYDMGHRDMFGFAWDNKGTLWVAEDGPSCNDEINRVVKGANYGWGPLSAAFNGNESLACKGKAPHNTNLDGQDITLPVWYWPADTVVAGGKRPPSITGLAYCWNCHVSSLQGMLIAGFVNAGNLQALNVAKPPKKPTEITKPNVIVNNGAGVLTVQQGPDGYIYYTDVTGKLFRILET